MNYKNITFESFRFCGFVFNWNDLFFAFKNNWVDAYVVENFATSYLVENMNCYDKRIIELASAKLDKLDYLIIQQYLSELVNEYDEKVTSKRWLFVVLSVLFFKNIDPYNKLLEVQEIYADFNYPDEIKSFVLYMPTNDGYNPKEHTQNENIARLLKLWSEYLEKTKIQLSSKGVAS
jgi:hypothetical protein